jgi:transcriptional regulator with XRE-family HTH domain
MAKTTSPLLPYTYELLESFGDRLRLARLRRKLTAKQVASLAGMVPLTLRGLEQGGAGVTIGAYLAVMQVLGIEHDLNYMVQADPVGRDLQDSRLLSKTKPALKKQRKPTRKAKKAMQPKLPPQLIVEPEHIESEYIESKHKTPKVKKPKTDKKSPQATQDVQWDWISGAEQAEVKS